MYNADIERTNDVKNNIHTEQKQMLRGGAAARVDDREISISLRVSQKKHDGRYFTLHYYIF